MKRRGSSRFLAARRWRGRSSPARSRPSECDASVYFCLHRRRISQFQTWVGAFLQALALSGWTIGRNVQIDTRWAGAHANTIQRHAAELVALALKLSSLMTTRQ